MVDLARDECRRVLTSHGHGWRRLTIERYQSDQANTNRLYRKRGEDRWGIITRM